MNSDYSSLAPNALWLSHDSVSSWLELERWVEYFARVQEILGAPITHLDENDPIRRRFDNKLLLENAQYVVGFGEQEDSRTLFGEFTTIGVDFSLHLYRNDPRWDNCIDWHFPESYLDAPSKCLAIERMFDCGNHLLETFYGYADTCEVHSKKSWRKKEFGAVDFQEELLGIYWLTYFNDRYVEFFNREKLMGLENLAVRLNGGVTLRLAETPSAVPDGLRQEIENALGPKSFVAWQRDITIKRAGQYALTFEQLRS
jgi:hypothetical protein